MDLARLLSSFITLGITFEQPDSYPQRQSIRQSYSYLQPTCQHLEHKVKQLTSA